jgi:hypothetical protein
VAGSLRGGANQALFIQYPAGLLTSGRIERAILVRVEAKPQRAPSLICFQPTSSPLRESTRMWKAFSFPIEAGANDHSVLMVKAKGVRIDSFSVADYLCDIRIIGHAAAEKQLVTCACGAARRVTSLCCGL